MKNKTKNKSAFSFLEVIISVFVLSAGLVAVLGPMANSLKQTMNMRDQEIAGFLAQESVEQAKNLRDSNIAGNITNSFDKFPLGNSNRCRFYSYWPECSPDDNGLKKRLSLNDDGFYVYDDSASNYTKFSRKVIFQYCGEISCSNFDKYTAIYIKVTSVVVWGGTFNNSIYNNLNANLYNVSADICNLSNKCSFAKTTLSRWGE